MTLSEKALYHQVHPAKLLADLAACTLALYALWLNMLLPGALTATLIPLAASAYLIRRGDLERCRHSRLGLYARKYLTRSANARRLLGYAVMALAAWHHSPAAVLFGASIVIHAWTAGLLVPRQAARM